MIDDDYSTGYLSRDEIRELESLPEMLTHRKSVEICRRPGTPFLSGWYFADVFLGPIPLIKLVLVLLTLTLIGVWR